MQTFISCDWGTTSLRVRLVNCSDLSILTQLKTDKGISATHRLWRQTQAAGHNKFFFYQSIITSSISELEKNLNVSLRGITVLISGMASSSLGMLELPYSALPFATDGSDSQFSKMPAGADFDHETIVISGVRSDDDAMRGEETQLIGCNIQSNEKRVFIFPGTHSKHVWVSDKKAFQLKTYMTGELLDLVYRYTILSASVEKPGEYIAAPFKMGVEASIKANLLNKLFSVRINRLFEKISATENYAYLEGLLIGTELQELVKETAPVVLVCDGPAKIRYLDALQMLRPGNIMVVDPAQATIAGHSRILGLTNLSK